MCNQATADDLSRIVLYNGLLPGSPLHATVDLTVIDYLCRHNRPPIVSRSADQCVPEHVWILFKTLYPEAYLDRTVVPFMHSDHITQDYFEQDCHGH